MGNIVSYFALKERKKTYILSGIILSENILLSSTNMY